MYKEIIKTHLLEYLKLKQIPYKKSGQMIMLACVFCGGQKLIANKVPNTYDIYCHLCKKRYDLIDIARHVEFGEKQPENDEIILHHLKEILKIKVMTKTDENNVEKILDFYVENGFDLVPIANNSKVPIESEWTTKSHKDKEEWESWIANSLNIGIKTGIKSNILAIDIDALSKPEKEEIRSGKISEKRKKELLELRKKRLEIVYKTLKPIMGEPLVQENLGGRHLIYKYDKDIPKTYIKVKDVHLDIEAEGGYILSFPSKLPNDSERKFNKLNKVPQLPEELKKFLLSKIDYKNIDKTNSEIVREDIITEDFKINPKKLLLKNSNLDGCCNTEFIKLGGILRKQLNANQTGYVLNVLNKHILENPMQRQAMNAMIRELDKYTVFDEKKLAYQILEYLKDVEEANRMEIAMAIVGTNRGEDKKRIDKVLEYLVREEYIRKQKNKYIIKKKAKWKKSLINIGIPIDFKMPYFNSVMSFNWGDLILIGSGNARGKTHISMNIIKQLIKQGKVPYYLSLESGSRFIKIACQLGLKEGEFLYDEVADASKIELEPNKAITVIDWLCPHNYAEVDKLLMHFTKQLQKTRGIAIVFMQLRDNGEWLAKDLVKQFPSFASRYIYNNEDTGEYGKFIIDKMRESKLKTKTCNLPAQYNWETKELTLIQDLENNKKEENKENGLFEKNKN